MQAGGRGAGASACRLLRTSGRQVVMRTVQVEDAVPGDVLAQPLTNNRGQVLLPKGAKLSAAVLSRCRGWGVDCVVLEGADPDVDDQRKLLEDLEIRFAGWERDPLMQRIKAFARAHLTGL